MVLCILRAYNRFKGLVRIAYGQQYTQLGTRSSLHHPHHLNLILSNIPYQGGAIIGVFMI
jgi:hypothetical protein